MIVVLVILGLVSGLVMTRGPSRSATLDMRVATAALAAVLRSGRSEAIASNRAVSVRFDASTATLRIGSGTPHSLPAGFGFSVITAGDQGAAIRFFPDGSSTGGRVELVGAGRTAQVGVDWLTGRVSVAAALP
jgi:general secretion pathway protein H